MLGKPHGGNPASRDTEDTYDLTPVVGSAGGVVRMTNANRRAPADFPDVTGARSRY